MLGCWVVLLSQGVTQVLLQPLRNQMGNVFPEAQGVGTSDVAYERQREEPLQLTLPIVPMHNDLLKWPSTQPLTPTTSMGGNLRDSLREMDDSTRTDRRL